MPAFRHSRSDPASGSPWLKFGRLLPATLRQRVFEPAYFDLIAEQQRRGRIPKRLGLKVLVLALEAYRVGGPSFLWDLRGTSRKAHLLALLLIIVVALTAFTMMNQYPDTASYIPSARP